MAKEVKADALQKLKNDLRTGQIGTLYFFHGEETFLLHHYLQQLKKQVVEELTESFNYHRFNSESFDMRSFTEAVENLPMMAEKTMVVVEDIELGKLNEEDRNHLASVLSDVPEYCVVVFTFLNVGFKPEKKMGKLYQAISDGETVEFPKQNQRDLVSWIQRHFAAAGKRIAPELCVYLLDLTDGTMTSLAGEIRKITAFSGADTICRADIDAVTEPVLDAVAFRMTDQIAAGDYGTALQTLQKLLKMQEEPLKILGSIGAHFRRLSVARILLDQGKGYGELMQMYAIRSDYTAKKSMEAARKVSPVYCQAAATLVMETDRKIKTSFDDPRRLLELLILQLSMEARNG